MSDISPERGRPKRADLPDENSAIFPDIDLDISQSQSLLQLPNQVPMKSPIGSEASLRENLRETREGLNKDWDRIELEVAPLRARTHLLRRRLKSICNELVRIRGEIKDGGYRFENINDQSREIAIIATIVSSGNDLLKYGTHLRRSPEVESAQKTWTRTFECLNNKLVLNIRLHMMLGALMTSFREISATLKPLMLTKDELEREIKRLERIESILDEVSEAT